MQTIIAYNSVMTLDTKDKVIFIAPKFGLGDSIVCNAIYRDYAKRYKYCVLPVFKSYKKSIQRMLGDLPNLIIVPYNNFLAQEILPIQKILMSKFGNDVLNLGSNENSFRENGTRNKIRFDEGFYHQANINFDKRWTDFYYLRHYKREVELFSELKCNEGSYQFVHEDTKRNFNIDQKYLNPDLKIVTPKEVSSRFSIFDYRLILENASEIHCIESSFAALIESISLDVPKFAHRYSRPEAKSNIHYEFTYKSDWTVLL
jgi:hypothetical protein